MLRRSLTSYWTAAILGLVLLGVYIAWGVWWEPGKRGEVVTGFGASLVVLGIFLAAHPFIRAGIRKTAASQVRSPGLSFYGSADRARNEEMMADCTMGRRRDGLNKNDPGFSDV